MYLGCIYSKYGKLFPRNRQKWTLVWKESSHTPDVICYILSNISSFTKHHEVGRKTSVADFFLTQFEVFVNLMKHSFECLIKSVRIKYGLDKYGLGKYGENKKIAKIYAN